MAIKKTRVARRERTPARSSAPAAGPRVVRIVPGAERDHVRALATRVLGLKAAGTKLLLAKLRQGLPYTAVTRASDALGVPPGEVARLAGIPSRTLSRRKAEGRLQPTESERLLRLVNVYARVVTLFEGDLDTARRWLTTPKRDLSGETPLEFAATEIGAREVEDLIGRLEHGVYS